MPRLSLWKEGQHSDDYKFFDRRISEMFTTGGLTIYVHKYLGPAPNVGSTDATQPENSTVKETNIQDFLWLENRDRKYDKDIYQLRGIYNVQDLDFDLSQFGLFLQSDTLFLTFHLNDMVDKLGRKLMSGDVLELPNLKDFWALDETLPVAIKRFYVVQEGIRSAEGYSPTWWSHLWRVKCNPMTNSQEFKDILDEIIDPATGKTVGDVLSPLDKLIEINDAVIDQALNDVPKSGYDTTPYWIPPFEPDPHPNSNVRSTDRKPLPPEASPNDKMLGYLVGDGIPPNGKTVSAGAIFPQNPTLGDYFLRLDFLPNRLFQFTGNRWVKVEDNVRTTSYKDRPDVAPGVPAAEDQLTQRDTFVDNSKTFVDEQGITRKSKQGLSDILGPKNDY
jgi:hypothetical protein